MSVIRLSSQSAETREFVRELLSGAKRSNPALEERVISEKRIRGSELESLGLDAFVVAEIARHDVGESGSVLSEKEACFGLSLFAESPAQMRALLVERRPTFNPYVKRIIFGNLVGEVRDPSFDEYDLKALRFDTGFSLDEFLAMGFTVTDLEGLHFTEDRVGAELKAAGRSLVAVFAGSEVGSGVIISNQGHLLLAAHEVCDSYRQPYASLEIACAGRLFKIGTADLVFDLQRDLAVIRCPALSDLIKKGVARVMPLASKPPHYGAPTVAVGFPHSDDDKKSFKVGYYDRRRLYEVGQYVGIGPRDVFDKTPVHGTTARLYPGSSGGALLDAEAKMFGLVTEVVYSDKTKRIVSSHAAILAPDPKSSSELDQKLLQIFEWQRD